MNKSSIDDYDENEDEAVNNFKIHEGIILAVHLTNSLTEKMTAIFSTFLNLLITLTKTMPNTGLGLYIFNCAKKSEASKDGNVDTPEGVFRVFRLQDLNQGMLKTLDRYLKNAIPTETVVNLSFNNTEKWNSLLPIKDVDVNASFGPSLYGMLQQTLLDFTNIPIRTEEYTSKKVFLFTDCQTPFNGKESIKQKIHNKLRDLNDFKITIYPFILRNEESEDAKMASHQIDEFKQLFDFPMDTDLEAKKYLPAISEISLETLEEKIVKHATVRRTAFQCPLIFGDVKIIVRGINPFTTAEWKKVKFYNIENRLKYVKKRNIPNSGDNEADTADIKKVYQVADQYMGMEEKIQTECMKFGESEKPILHVVGTRKFKYFNSSYIISKAVFVIAGDDEELESSNSLDNFAALYRSLCKKKMMILCWGMPRKTSYPRFFYLIPTGITENFGLKFEKYPHALAMVEVPFGNEVRKAPEYINKLDSLSELDDTHILDKLIEKLTLDGFEAFSNPSLSWKFKVMEDHILQREVPRSETRAESNEEEEEESSNFGEQQLELDEMYQQMLLLRRKINKDESLQSLVKELQSRYNRVSNYNELKRTSDNVKSEKLSAKKSRGLKFSDPLTDAKAIIFYRECGLQNCTNDVLRNYIKSKGGLIKIGKTKGDMIDNVVAFLKSNQLL